MTKDKQIIVDGVDVRGCEFATKAEGFLDTHCRLYDYKYCIGKDCHYKNWKRKEQECEELKDKLNCCFCNPYVELHDIEKQRKCVEVTECFRQQLDQLKAENEELKRELVVKGNILTLVNETKKEYLKQLDRLKQTLTEITEIAQYDIYTSRTDLCLKLNWIKKKISEVE